MKNILLVQFRRDSSALLERNCFLRYFRKKKDLKLKTLNVFDKKIDFSNPQKLLVKTQGVILGGSGEFYLSGNEGEKEKVFQNMLEGVAPFIKYLLQNNFPTLGICFGHQILGYFLGGKPIADKNQAETGSFLVSLTKEGKKSPLFSGIPLRFYAQFGHRDSLGVLPKGAKLLARTKKCKVVAFEYKGRILGVQFHPELSRRDILLRLKLYPHYAGKNLDKIKRSLRATPYSSKVIKNFLNKICFS